MRRAPWVSFALELGVACAIGAMVSGRSAVGVVLIVGLLAGMGLLALQAGFLV